MVKALAWMMGAVLLASLLVNAVLVFRFVWTRSSPSRRLGIRLCLSAFSLCFALIAAEVYCSFFLVQSDGWSITAAGRAWLKRYWQPINSHGYRDIEHSDADFSAKNVVYVVGDSFAAGHGIEQAEDRFSDILQRRLGAGWTVANMAKCGWDTEAEHVALASYPHRPDTVVLAYTLNDIEESARQHGIEPSWKVMKTPRVVSAMLEVSALADYVYWQVQRRRKSDLFINGISASYDDAQIWSTQQGKLQAIVDFCAACRARLIVVVFPAMSDVTGTARFTAQVSRFFEDQGIAAVDLGPLLQGWPVGDLVVGSLDAHPGEKVHRFVADLLFGQLRQKGRPDA